MTHARLWAGLAALLLLATGAAAFALGGGGVSTASTISPDGAYRIDWVTPNRLERLLHGDMELPGRIRLYNMIDRSFVGVSDVVDLASGDHGRVAWLMKDIGMVSVGPGVQFLHVPPLARDGTALPIGRDYTGSMGK